MALFEQLGQLGNSFLQNAAIPDVSFALLPIDDCRPRPCFLNALGLPHPPSWPLNRRTRAANDSEAIIPWPRLLGDLAPFCPQGARGRPSGEPEKPAATFHPTKPKPNHRKGEPGKLPLISVSLADGAKALSNGIATAHAEGAR